MTCRTTEDVRTYNHDKTPAAAFCIFHILNIIAHKVLTHHQTIVCSLGADLYPHPPVAVEVYQN